jgi:hypothetical protein
MGARVTNEVITDFMIDGAFRNTYSSTNLDERVRKSPGVSVERGTSDLSSVFTSASSSFTLNNADGLFASRNPLSPLFRKFPRFTKVRHRIPTAAGSMDYHVKFFRPDESGSFSTTDKAGIEISGDIDIRFEITPDIWQPWGELTDTTGIGGYAICGKYQISGGNRSWVIWLNNGAQFNLRWSPDGANVRDMLFQAQGTLLGRQCMRITLDVDNGIGGCTGTIYHADTMAGPWTQIQQIVQPLTTSIYAAGSAPLQMGNVDTGSPLLGQTQLFGKFHSFELRNGINGTLVAKADANVSGVDVGTTSWNDGLGNTWTLTGSTRVGSDRIRHTGELDTLDYRWDETRRDANMPVKSLGAMNRLQEAGSAVNSPMYNTLVKSSSIVGYWTFEQGAGTRTINSEANIANYATLVGTTLSGSSPDGLPGSAGALTLNSATSRAVFGAAGRTSNGLMTAFVWFKLNSLPASDKVFATYQGGSGTVTKWEFKVGSAGYAWVGSNSSGTVVSDATLFGTGASPLNQWIGMQLTLSQEGGNVRYAWRWFGVDSGRFYIHNTGGSTYAGTVGRLGTGTFDANADTAFNGAQLSHFVLARSAFTINNNTYYQAAIAYEGELAGDRADRIAQENGVELEIYGAAGETQPMGPQPLDTPYNLIAECATVDSGMLFDVRDRFCMGMLTRVYLENRVEGFWSFGYSSSLLSQTPAVTEDGRYTKNVMTLNRPGGGTARFEQPEGPLSVSEPPDGIGPRGGTGSINVFDDDQLQRLTEYEVYKRTRDELRIPSLKFEMNRSIWSASSANVDQYERTVAGDIGDWCRIFNLPRFVDYLWLRYFLVLGYVESFNGDTWSIEFNTVTADGYRVPLVNYHYLGDDDTTTTTALISSTATSVSIKTPISSRPWLPSSHSTWYGGYYAYLGGEQVFVTAMSDPVVVGSDYQQTATINRSLNGIVKLQEAGSPLEWIEPFYLGVD